jgi:Holliday junction resolvase RusA-like endonuclease
MIEFQVRGYPKAKGSLRGVALKGKGGLYTGKVWMAEQTGQGLLVWRTQVREAARANAPEHPVGGPVTVHIQFALPRPAKPRYELPIGRNSGDVDKLVRAVLDELTGVIFGDDSQVVELHVLKLWDMGGGAGALITVDPWGSESVVPVEGVGVPLLHPSNGLVVGVPSSDEDRGDEEAEGAADEQSE